MHIKVPMRHRSQRSARSRWILEETTENEGGRHILPRMESADQQGDKVTGGARQGQEVVSLVPIFAEFKPELAVIQRVDDNLGVVSHVRRHNLPIWSTSTRVHNSNAILGDVDLEIPRVRVVLVAEVAYREPAPSEGNWVFQAHPRDGVQLNRSHFTIRLTMIAGVSGLRDADDAHADIICRSMVHGAIDARDVYEVGPDAALPATLDWYGLLARRPRRSSGYKNPGLTQASTFAPRLEMESEVVAVVTRDRAAPMDRTITGSACLPQQLLRQIPQRVGNSL
mmetsp:Transcript_30134/g.65794  ORF Transcript_30134/g.65794 Transcript_30134/m.65794 type:complete len:282 (-) Transcript_30134:95-940(-)